MTNPSPDTSAAEVVGRLRHLISLNEPRNGGPYAGIAAEACMKAMADAITTIDTSRAETAAANARAEAAVRDCRMAQNELGRAYSKVGELALEKAAAEAKLAKAVEEMK